MEAKIHSDWGHWNIVGNEVTPSLMIDEQLSPKRFSNLFTIFEYSSGGRDTHILWKIKVIEILRSSAYGKYVSQVLARLSSVSFWKCCKFLRPFGIGFNATDDDWEMNDCFNFKWISVKVSNTAWYNASTRSTISDMGHCLKSTNTVHKSWSSIRSNSFCENSCKFSRYGFCKSFGSYLLGKVEIVFLKNAEKN